MLVLIFWRITESLRLEKVSKSNPWLNATILTKPCYLDPIRDSAIESSPEDTIASTLSSQKLLNSKFIEWSVFSASSIVHLQTSSVVTPNWLQHQYRAFWTLAILDYQGNIWNVTSHAECLNYTLTTKWPVTALRAWMPL